METKPTLSAEQIPPTYARCFQEDCPKADTCARFLAGKYIPEPPTIATTTGSGCSRPSSRSGLSTSSGGTGIRRTCASTLTGTCMTLPLPDVPAGGSLAPVLRQRGSHAFPA